MNFWEARQAALEGKKVRRYNDTVFTKEDFSCESFEWSGFDIDAEWEIVEEPKTITRFVTVYPDGGYDWAVSVKIKTSKTLARTGYLGRLEIITDAHGKLISARNV